jgi:hypothetical protein
MPVDRHYVRGLAETFVEALGGLSQKERAQPVSGSYARNLNNLIALAKEVAPEHDARLWPEPIKIQDAQIGIDRAMATYAEIETIARQIMVLLPRELMM